MIDYSGSLSSSKSLVNRVLLLENIFKNFKSSWFTEAQDVILLNKALRSNEKETFFVGEGGTTFRFLSVFLSSQKGEWKIKANPTLLKRPHDDLYNFFDDQGVECKVRDDSMILKSSGWNLNRPLKVSSQKTTQVLSAVFLSALRFKKSFILQLKNKQESNYFKMTEDLLKNLGLEYTKKDDQIIFNSVKELDGIYEIEGDWSSSAFLYVLAALKGEVNITNLEEKSLQPDSVVLKILKDSGVDVDGFRVSSKNFGIYNSQKINLRNFPDLFPVLSAFFAFTKGRSHLFGAYQLAFKESNRIFEVYKILNLCGYKIKKYDDGVTIIGEGDKILDHEEFEFDCSTDHRIFMCAYILKFAGYKINIIGEKSIKKSFPDFFDLEKRHVFFDRS